MTGSEIVDNGNGRGDGVSVRVARGTKEAVYAVPRSPEDLPGGPDLRHREHAQRSEGAAAGRTTAEAVAQPLRNRTR